MSEHESPPSMSRSSSTQSATSASAKPWTVEEAEILRRSDNEPPRSMSRSSTQSSTSSSEKTLTVEEAEILRRRASAELISQTSNDSIESRSTTLSFESTDSPPPPPPPASLTDQADSKKTYVERYSAEIVGCGYLRLSCQIIDRYIKFGSVDGSVPTKLEIDAKYVKMLEAMVQKQVREIVAGTEKSATKCFLDGLMRARDEALKEKDSETAIEVWERFESRYPRSLSNGSSSRSVSQGSHSRSFSNGSSTRSVSNVSSNGSKDESVTEERPGREVRRGRVGVPLIKQIQKPQDSEKLFVPRKRRSSLLSRSPLIMAEEGEDS